MKKAVTFRIDPDLLERARRLADADNRSLTNYVETALRRAIERSADSQESER
jgi:predicted transcriptional regulator